MTFIRRHLLRGEGKLNAFQLRPTSTTTGVPGSHLDIHVNVNAQNRNVTVILQALLDLRFEVEFCAVSTYGTASSLR